MEDIADDYKVQIQRKFISQVPTFENIIERGSKNK